MYFALFLAATAARHHTKLLQGRLQVNEALEDVQTRREIVIREAQHCTAALGVAAPRNALRAAPSPEISGEALFRAGAWTESPVANVFDLCRIAFHDAIVTSTIGPSVLFSAKD